MSDYNSNSDYNSDSDSNYSDDNYSDYNSDSDGNYSDVHNWADVEPLKESIEAIVKSLKDNSSFGLNLSWYKIENEDISVLVEALKVNSSLTGLVLRHTNIEKKEFLH